MKKLIVLLAAVCLAWAGFSEKVLAGPAPVSAQEGVQLSQLGGNDVLLAMKAGGSFPNSPSGVGATEESVLKNLQKGSPNLGKMKAGDGPVDVLVVVAVVVLCILLLRLVV